MDSDIFLFNYYLYFVPVLVVIVWLFRSDFPFLIITPAYLSSSSSSLFFFLFFWFFVLVLVFLQIVSTAVTSAEAAVTAAVNAPSPPLTSSLTLFSLVTNVFSSAF